MVNLVHHNSHDALVQLLDPGVPLADLFIPPHIYVKVLAHIPPLMVWWSEIGLLLLHLFNTVHTLQLNDFALNLGT